MAWVIGKDSDLADIHRRVLQGDPTASLALFQNLHYRMVRLLSRQFGRQLPKDEIGNLATDAMVEYLNNPNRYDPGRANLYSYLTLIAKRDGLNRLRSLQSEQKKLRLFFDQVVEPGRTIRNKEEEGVERALDATTILDRYGQEIVDDEEDEAILRLMLLGESDTAAYASVLRITHLPVEQQRVAVKQRRDRLEKRLERLKGKL